MPALKLRTKILLSVGCIILMVLGTSTIFHTRSLKQNYLEALQWRSEALAQTLIPKVIELDGYDPKMQRTLGLAVECDKLYEANKAKGVIQVGVINEADTVAAHSDPDLWDTAIESPALLERLHNHEKVMVLDGKVYQSLVPVLNAEGRYFGAITIGTAKDTIDTKVRSLIYQAIALLVLFGGVAFVVTSALVHVVVTQPIRRLVATSQNIARGELDQNSLGRHAVRSDASSPKGKLDEIDALTAAFQEMTTYLHEMAQTATQIAAGNLGQEVRPRSERDVLGRAFQQMSAYLKEMAGAATTISSGDVRLQIQPKSEHDVLGNAFHDLVAYFQNMALTASRIASGDLNHEIVGRSEHDELGNAFYNMATHLQNILRELDGLVQAVQEGDLSRRGKIESFSGDWRYLVEGLNNVIELCVKPINMTASHLEQMAQGSLPEKITESYHGDFNVIKHSVNDLIEATRNVASLAEMMAAGDLSIEISERSADDMLMQSLNAMLDKLSGIVLKAKASADYMAGRSQTISSEAERMAEGAAQQAAAAEEVSSSMEEMVANIRQNADNAKMTEKIARESAKDARQGGQAVARTVEAMKEIDEKISIIQEIAMQTNILSMNATIEAAKAQDYGKGFAVVASEVRSLAQRSREAAEGIETLVKSCVIISEQAGEILQRLVPSSEETAKLVQEINVASSEQYSGVTHINLAIQQLDQVVQQNAATSGELAVSSEELTSQAEQLQRIVAFFTVKEALPPEAQAVDKGDIMEVLRILMAQGADEQALAALLKSIRKAEKEDSGSREESGPKQTAEEASAPSAHEELKASGREINLRMSSDESPAQRGFADERDDEFEHF